MSDDVDSMPELTTDGRFSTGPPVIDEEGKAKRLALPGARDAAVP